MLKKFILSLLVAIAMFLTGCAVDKTVSIPKSNPDVLFMQTLATIKRKLPQAKIQLDLGKRTLNVTTNDEKYPANLALSFTKNGTDTDLQIKTEEASEIQIANLQDMLTHSFVIKK